MTDADGRCTDLLTHDFRLSPGIYKMTFFTGPYFLSTGSTTFYPLVEVSSAAESHADPSDHLHLFQPRPTLSHPSVDQSLLIHDISRELVNASTSMIEF